MQRSNPGLPHCHTAALQAACHVETWVLSLGWEDTLEKGMATHSSILAWKIPWTEELGGLQSMGSRRVRHDLMANTFTFTRQIRWSVYLLQLVMNYLGIRDTSHAVLINNNKSYYSPRVNPEQTLGNTDRYIQMDLTLDLVKEKKIWKLGKISPVGETAWWVIWAEVKQSNPSLQLYWKTCPLWCLVFQCFLYGSTFYFMILPLSNRKP